MILLRLVGAVARGSRRLRRNCCARRGGSSRSPAPRAPRRQRAQTHRRAVEAAHDGLDRFHLGPAAAWRRRGFKREQVAQGGRRAPVHVPRHSLPVGALAAAHRDAATAPPGCTGGIRRRARNCSRPPCSGSALSSQPTSASARVRLQPRKPAPPIRDGVPRSNARHLVLIQPDDLEQARAAIAGDVADAHLRQDLQQPLLHPAPVAAPICNGSPRWSCRRGCRGGQPWGLIREVRIHRGRRVADQAGSRGAGRARCRFRRSG